MSRLRPSVLPSLLVVFALIAFAACGGGSDDSKTPTSEAGSTPAGTTPDSSDETVDASDEGGTTDPELRAIAQKFAESTFSATYKTTGSEEDGLGAGTLTLAKDGDARFRFEITSTQDGIDESSILIETPEVSAICLKEAGELGALVGVDPDKGICFESDAASEGGSLRDIFAGAEDINETLLEKSERTIAGQDGTCYRTQDNADGEISTVCFTGDGVLLYLKNEGDASSEIEAQTVSSSVSASDFELPYELKKLPELGG